MDSCFRDLVDSANTDGPAMRHRWSFGLWCRLPFLAQFLDSASRRDALYAAGVSQNPNNSVFPGQVFNDALTLPGAQYVYIPKGSAIPPTLAPFNRF